MTDCGYEIKAPWTIGDNNEWDDEIWSLIMLEDGITPEEDNVEIEEEYVDEFGDE
jgi:hypothetical protein